MSGQAGEDHDRHTAAIHDTGARRAAAELRDARIALDLAITAAGRALADRELPVRRFVALPGLDRM
jgi:hypothetical protein